MRLWKPCLRRIACKYLDKRCSARLLVAFPLASLFLMSVMAVATPADRSLRFAGGNWRRGETLYRQNCASCHRADLKGRGMAPLLLGVTRHMDDDEIIAHARRIGETMCCARHLRNITDREFGDIVAYFHAVDRDPRVRGAAAQAGGGGSCCAMRRGD
jgi:mono/diheme cytochrome c family protein